MTQFVEQLRNQAKWYAQPGYNARDLMDSRMLEKAADEIECLRAKIEAAEKSDAESLAMYRRARDERDNANSAATAAALQVEKLQAENEALAANLRGKHATTGATYAHLIAERDALHAKIEAAEKERDTLRTVLTDLLNDLEERAKWNLEESQRVVACGNGVYMRAKAALKESK